MGEAGTSAREPTGGDLEAVLRARLGHASFRPGQREIVEAVLSGRDTLAVLPTGGGKSLTYQFPALVTGACSLVVSPLVALMRDQVESARRVGIRAAGVDSTRPAEERVCVLDAVRAGRIEVLYASPEGLPRLARDLAGASPFGLFAVDEAHCIAHWGHDFRPDYLRLAEARGLLAPAVPLVAVTATATPRVRDEIVALLGMADPVVHVGSFFRPNLRLAAWRKDPVVDARDAIAALLRAHQGESAIVYRISRSGASSLAGWLRRHGVSATAYHAGLEPEERARVQDAFLDGRCRVIVATVAFGMGVDKADVRLVVHADLPGSLEAYAQEVGRAGRDGRDSDCVLLYSWSDVKRRESLVSDLPPERRRAAVTGVREVYRFATAASCRQRALCAHFGEVVARPCGACDACGVVSAGRLLRAGGW
jgi:ATP-dependent DNA helicase RecQ